MRTARLRLICQAAIMPFLVFVLISCFGGSTEIIDEPENLKFSEGTYSLSDSLSELDAQHFIHIHSDSNGRLLSYKGYLGNCWLRESHFNYKTDDSAAYITNVSTQFRRHCDSSWKDMGSEFILDLTIPLVEVSEDSFVFIYTLDSLAVIGNRVENLELESITKEISRSAYNWPEFDDNLLFPQHGDTLVGDSVEFTWKLTNKDISRFHPQLKMGTYNPPVIVYALENYSDTSLRIIPPNNGFSEGVPYYWNLEIDFQDSVISSPIKQFYVKPFPDRNANLKSIGLVENTIQDQFYINDNSFSAEVGSEIDSIRFKIETREEGAKVLINGDTLKDNNSKKFKVSDNSNTFNLVVISQDGNVIKSHTLSVYRHLFNAARLKKLELKGLALKPAFHPDNRYYDVVIPPGIDSITYTAVPEDTNSRINSSLPNAGKDTVFGLKLSGGTQDHITSHTVSSNLTTTYDNHLANYKLDLIYTDTRLAGITINSKGNEIKLNEKFNPEDSVYSINVNPNDDLLELRLEAYVPGLFILINGQAATVFPLPGGGPITYNKSLSVNRTLTEINIEINAAKDNGSKNYRIQLKR